MRRSLLILPAALVAAASLPAAGAASPEKEYQVQAIFEQMEADVLAFRDEMERVYAARCDAATLTECARGNYNDCSSTYPNQVCMEADELVLPTCGDGVDCNGLWDKTLTAVRIPEALAQSGNPSDPDVIESVCYSRLAEPYMINNYSNQMYYGSASGSFRIVPARHSEVCGQYDPRRRPWYVAASSGPKDVVMVIDVSGSMEEYGRMELAKEAASTIVSTLTVADRVAIVTFSDKASLVGGQTSLIRATSDNKKLLIDAVNGLEPGGPTNFYDAFDKTFNALDATIRNEATTGCNIAVLFLTDGQITAGQNEEDVINLVNDRTTQLSTNFGRDTTVFTFSLGFQADHEVTKRIACDTAGLWTKVEDYSGDLVSAMASYYKLYALGLGEGGNDDFVSWVEPYKFATGDKMGTSVSVPVYDRSVEPPLFLGVAAVDVFLDDIEEILGEDASSSSMLNRFVLLSTARCPKIELSDLELNALRFLGGGDEAMCEASNATDATAGFAGIVPEQCPFQSDLPRNLWANTEMEGKAYVDRACCESGGAVPSDSCPAQVETESRGEEGGSSDSSTGVIIGVVVGVVAVVAILALVFAMKKRQSSKSGTGDEEGRPSNAFGQQTSIDHSVTIAPPPPVAVATAVPPNNPAFSGSSAPPSFANL